LKIVWRTFLTVIWGDRRDENQLAAALARARKDQKRRGSTTVGGALEDLSPLFSKMDNAVLADRKGRASLRGERPTLVGRNG
jgi:hypothetical protein